MRVRVGDEGVGREKEGGRRVEGGIGKGSLVPRPNFSRVNRGLGGI